MKFGRRLETEQEEAFRPYYIRYNALKALLKATPDAPRDDARNIRATINRRLTPPDVQTYGALPSSNSPAAQFIQMLEADLERATRFVTLQVEDIKLRSRSLAARAAGAVSPAELDRIEAAADDVAAAAVRLDRFILLNYCGFVKILKKHDRLTGLCTKPWLLSRLSAGSLLQVRFDQVVTALSDAYAAVRARREGSAPDSGAAWVPPASFERATTKYWVAPEDVLAVKCALVKHLPVLIFGRSAGFNAAQRDVPSDSSLISSVYYDNADLDVYLERLERQEGATLIRMRWYGDTGGDCDDEAELFVERKTHHESWTTDNSVKERFRLKAKHVTTLMRGELDLETHLEKLRAGGASAEDVARTRTLAAEVGKELHSRALAPALRTVYYRTAFQLASSNAVRVSLDTQLRMLDERDAPPGADGVHGWCRRPDAMPPLGQQQVVEFPFAVLEIKLQDQAPDWVEELLASGRLVQCTKFSKFLHGTAALRPAEVPKVPHWWDDAAVASTEAAAAAATAADSAAAATGGARSSTGPVRAFSQCSMGIAENGSVDDLAAMRTPAQQPRTGPLPRSMSAPPSATLETVVTVTHIDNVVAVGEDAHIKTEGRGAEAPAAPAAGVGRWLKPLAAVRGAFSRAPRGGNPPSAPPAAGGALLTVAARRHVPIKIEPKTFFANERTMLQWLNMATLILFTSLALTAYNDPVTHNKRTPEGNLDYSSQIAGAVLAPVAVVFIVYALWTYLWRARRIARREASARYDDRIGPAVLVLLLLVVTVTSIVLSISRADWHRHNTVVKTKPSKAEAAPSAAMQKTGPASFLRAVSTLLPSAHDDSAVLDSSTPVDTSLRALGMLNASAAAAGGACGQLPVEWPPFFRPKGVAFASQTGGNMLLGGDYTLARLSLHNVSDVRLLPAPGWSVASLAATPGGLLLGAARPANTLALYDADGTVRRATDLGGSLLGASPTISAISTGPDGTLLVTASSGVEALRLGAAPSTGPFTWQAERFLPAESLAAGLADGHVAALAYDGRADVLHVLFDRAQPPLLRTFRLGNGQLGGDWELPTAAAAAPATASSLTWSGLALTPDGSELYAVRAWPPQLWRFARHADGALACSADAA